MFQFMKNDLHQFYKITSEGTCAIFETKRADSFGALMRQMDRNSNDSRVFEQQDFLLIVIPYRNVEGVV